MRAVVSMPRSLTSAMRAMPKRFLILSTCRPTVVGSAVFPGEHLDRQGAASGRAQQPEHDQGGVLEVPVGEAGLDPALTGQQPVEHGKHLVARDGSQAQQGAEAGVGGFR